MTAARLLQQVPKDSYRSLSLVEKEYAYMRNFHNGPFKGNVISIFLKRTTRKPQDTLRAYVRLSPIG